MPYKKYYWYAQVETNKNNTYSVSEKSEMHTLYYLPAPEIAVHNVEGDWAAVVTWKHNDLFKDATITLTPDKDCEYDKTPITVSATQDSCYISAGSEFSKKYTVYHQWWDDSKAQYYEPVVYSFTATFSGEADGTPFTVTAAPVNYIFLDRATYAADKQFNVYRMGRIGNRTWLLEDLRGNSKRMATSPLGFKACFYGYYSYNDENIIPEGCHLASDDDWQDLEYTYGIEKQDCNSYAVKESLSLYSCILKANPNFETMKNDTTVFVGHDSDIRQKLISKNEWITMDSTKTIIDGVGLFNVRPYGWCIYGHEDEVDDVGTKVVYLTSTIDENNNTVIARVVWSENNGLGRVKITNCGAVYYIYRCVKDE